MKKFNKYINHYLMNKIRSDKGHEFLLSFPIYKKWANELLNKNRNYDFKNKIMEYWNNRIIEIKKNQKRNILKEDRKNIVISLLLMFPRLERKEWDGNSILFKKEHLNIYHYTHNKEKILSKGMKPSNFLNNFNDNKEVMELLDKSKLEKNKYYLDVYNSTIIKKYNSFSYDFLSPDIQKSFSKNKGQSMKKIQISLNSFINKWQKSEISKYIYYGFVRYDSGGKIPVYDFINFLIKELYTNFPLSRGFIKELISIVTAFVKNDQYKDEKEIRILYTDLNPKFIPNHFIKVSD